MSVTHVGASRPTSLALALLLALALVPLGAAHDAAEAQTAPTITVSTTQDLFRESCYEHSGYEDCSLREAVWVANEEPGTTILLPDHGEPYELTRSGAGENSTSTGDLDLDEPTTIIGQGSGTTELTAAWDDFGSEETTYEAAPDRFFHVRGAVLTLEGLTLRGGEVAGGYVEGDGYVEVGCDEGLECYGGAIYVQQGESATGLTTDDVVIRDSAAEAGGAIAMDTLVGSLEMEDSAVTGNTADDGGGLALAGVTAQLTATAVTDNTGDQGGGGVRADRSDLELTDVEISGNHSSMGTGGIELRGGTGPSEEAAGDLSMVDSTVAENRGGPFGAAGMTLRSAALEIAASGWGTDGDGAGTADYHDTPYELAVRGTTFADNVSAIPEVALTQQAMPYFAGGMWVQEAYNGSIVNSTFSGNQAPDTGAGAGLRVGAVEGGDLALAHVTFEGNAPSGEQVEVRAADEHESDGGDALHIDEPESEDGGENGVEAADSHDGMVSLSHTVLSGSGSVNCAGDLSRLGSAGHNLDDDGSCGLDGEGDAVVSDAGLGELGDNGGPTATHLPADDSPAVDGGTDGECPAGTDQRGTARPQGSGCDVGAVELEIDDAPFGCDPHVADQFGDVHPAGPHRDSIGCAADLGFVVGFEDGDYRPTIDMSRGQFATVVARMIEFILDDELPIDEQVTFPDVPASHVHEPGIRKLATAGLIRGFEDGDFRPGHSLRRGQASTILEGSIVTATGQQLPDGPDAFLDDDGSPHEQAMNRLAHEGILNGYGQGEVRPSEQIERGQLASMVIRTLVTVEGLLVGQG